MSRRIKPKLFRVAVHANHRGEMIVRALTEQGALSYAARSIIDCELADGDTLVRLVKEGVPAYDAIDNEPDLFGARSIEVAPVPE